jgi:hypothetical protein
MDLGIFGIWNYYLGFIKTWKLGKIFESPDIWIWEFIKTQNLKKYLATPDIYICKFCVFRILIIFGTWNKYFANLEISKLTKIFGI